MALNYTDKITIKNWFKKDDKPNQKQFWSMFDSYWHKSESLPISSVEGLGSLIDGKAETNHTHTEYATNDASSLTAQNVTSWKEKLGVADLKFDDKAITITQDYADFGLASGASINSFNNAVYVEVNKKLNAPTENATADYVLLADGSVAAKSDFGKVDKVMNVAPDANKNVDFSGVPMNWTNANHRFSALPDKSADATYNQFSVLDSNGNFAKAGKPFNAFKNFLTQCTIAESTELGQLLNGGQGSSGAISVNLISPPIIQNRFNNVEYVLLRGANLLLNSLDMSISICDANKNVIQQIPNNQIINNSASELVFYYNFYQFPLGTYYIKITSGVRVYYTTIDLKIVQEVEDINLEEITWTNVTETGVTLNPNDVYHGRSFVLNTPAYPSYGITNSYSFKTNELFELGADFYIECELTVNQSGNNTDSSSHDTRIGIGYSHIENSLVPIPNVYLSVKKGNFNTITHGIQNANYSLNANVPITLNFVIIKTGNLFRIIQGIKQYSITLSNNSGYSMFFQTAKKAMINTYTLLFLRAFKFN